MPREVDVTANGADDVRVNLRMSVVAWLKFGFQGPTLRYQTGVRSGLAVNQAVLNVLPMLKMFWPLPGRAVLK